MGNSTLPTVLDKMVMVANIHTRKLIANFSEELKQRDPVLEDMNERIKFLEERMEGINSRLKKITILQDQEKKY